ncbi:MAG TPA: RNA pyrophosphohydrolase [Candidatus Sulfotelmatobacter sp.]|jgi:putative (di)nucleoside polyphosphate hydrolase|nr:RNA pyrophosphohydrolase [Candidatus Sulfotelmatobacter sp.]
MQERTEYRSGVGIVLINREGLVFAGHRRDNRPPPWQMPQGGLNPGEHPHAAAFREMAEELGTSRAVIASELADWHRYDYPDAKATKRAQHFRGQQHKWLLLRFTGQDHEIDLRTRHPEFSQWRWLPPQEVIASVAPFKRDVYRRVLADFAEDIARIRQRS